MTDDDVTSSTSSVGNPYMFTGRRYDSQIDKYYYRARYYDADTGRFLSPDPIGYYDSMNLYQYVTNNPLNWIDPWGLSEYWRWSKWDIITFAPHWIFDRGVDIGNKLVGTPPKVKKMINKPKEIRGKRYQQIDNILNGGHIPKTAGPKDDFIDWAKDTTDVITSIPGTSPSGPLPTSGTDVVTDIVKGAIVDGVNKSDKKCEKGQNSEVEDPNDPKKEEK